MPAFPREIPNMIVPVGTQVVARADLLGGRGEMVCPKGSVGAVIQSPVDADHSYRVRLLDNREISLKRTEFAVLKHFKKGQLADVVHVLEEFNLEEFVIYRCIVGSRAFGLAEGDADVDRRGIYLPPADLHWSLYGVPEQLETPGTADCYWELRKFLILALKANPNILECLYTPLVEKVTPLARELLDMRSIFLSKLVYQTYNGYVLSQFKKLAQDLRTHGHIRWKHAMHLIRLLLSGITVLREGVVRVGVEEYKDRLLAIRREEVPWEAVNVWCLALHKEFEAAFLATKLPERPDYERANAFLIKARRSMAEAGP